MSVSRVFLYLGIWFARLALHLLLEFFVLGDVSCVFTCACNIYLAFVFLKGLQNNTHVEDLTFCHFSHFRGCKLDFRCFIVCFGSVVP